MLSKRLRVVKLNVEPKDPIIKPMKLEDIDEVLEFFHDWNRDLFLEEIKNPFSYNFVLYFPSHRNYQEIIGFINFWIVPDGIELNNIIIRDEYRGKGYGALLMDFLIKCAQFLKSEKIFLEVKEDNLIAQNLYKKYGFKKLYVRKRYYSDNKDAIVMIKEL